MILPTLSVVIPNYNHARLLPTCVQALLGQSVQPMEIIILDDASTDNSVEVIQDFAARNPIIRFYRNEKNQGVVFGMNRGLELARGDYLYFAAADDKVLPGLLEKSLRLLAQHPQAALSCTISAWQEVNSGLSWHMGVGMAEQPCYLSPARMVELEKQGKLFIASNTALFKRSSILRAGGFIPQLKWHCDWFGMYVSGFRDGICFVPEPLAVAYIYSASFHSAGRRNKQEYRQVLRQMLDLLNRSDYADAAQPIRESGALFLFGRLMLQLMLSHTEYQRFINPVFLRKNLWHSFKLEMKKITPAFIANWYLHLSGYKARGSSS
jgi:glycosyltransferase involved in cell wall biosynthesis